MSGVRRPLHLCRSWLFVDGADEGKLFDAAPQCGADVLVQDLINRALTPSKAKVDRARRILQAFAGARAGGQSRVELDGSLIEKPLADRAERLLRRAKELGAIEEGG